MHSLHSSDFAQVVQWDGYVINEDAWTGEFLQYDYIGARWWFRPEGSNVGNGGFSLRSRKLMTALADPAFEAEHPEDLAIGVRFRPALEKRFDIRFAPSLLADRYAFEGETPAGGQFGFHRMFNLPYFTGQADLADVLGQLGEQQFCNPGAITLIEKLAALGRLREAARYARRLRACRDFSFLPQQFRFALATVMEGPRAAAVSMPPREREAFQGVLPECGRQAVALSAPEKQKGLARK